MRYTKFVHMNHTDKLIYHYVVTHLDVIESMHIRNVADGAYTSTASVIRFYKKLGADSFETFKKEIHLLYDGEHLADQTDAEMEFHHYQRYYHSCDFNLRVTRAANMIRSNNEIILLGIGNSGIMAVYGARYLSNVGYYATAITDPDYPPPMRGYQDRVLIAISESGETKEVLKQVSMYKDFHAQVIAITNTDRSSLCDLADLVLSYRMRHVCLPMNYNLTSCMPVVYIIERLGKELFQKDHRVLEYIQKDP